MGLSTPLSIYQARFAKYLENRGLKPRNGGKVWNFIGDGEADEPEVLGTINIAVRERLDNLILVVNCNLQRLDGPVRGNGKIIQELERSFRGSGWNVIKVIWSGEWDHLFARDHRGVLQRRMEEAVDGDYQYYTVSDGPGVRDHWVRGNPELAELMKTLSDEEIRVIKRGGQDRKKIYAAFHKASQSQDKPTVILMKTIKGDGLGSGAEGRNTAHQKKAMSEDELLQCAKKFDIPLDEEAIRRADFYRPPEDSRELQYMQSRRSALGGLLPHRNTNCVSLATPKRELFQEFFSGTGDRPVSSTMALVRMLSKLMKDKDIGQYIVPIIPDEARTFGMDALFRDFGIYSSEGQKYSPVDASSLLPYKEAQDGQILQEGICETGALASFAAAGSAYSTHGIPMIPFYVFYSIFGFQRVGDMIWACGDMMVRGFLCGGTAGRTTLNSEGLQHQDGHSHLVANTIPNMLSYDPAFAYELAVIVRDGLHRMYDKQENVFYYLTVMNENYPMPAMPDDPDIEDKIIKGMYRYETSDFTGEKGLKAHIFGSGTILMQVLKAKEILENYGVSTDVWSVTSYNQLSRQAQDVERYNMLHPDETPKTSFLEDLLKDEEGVFVAASDYVKALPESVGRWIPGPYTVLGTDGYGVSESREDLRAYFEVSAEYIAFAALSSLARQAKLSDDVIKRARKELSIDPKKANPRDL